MDEWREVKIGDLASRITSGGTPLTKNTEYYDGNIPWLNTKEIKNCRIVKTRKCITELGLNNSSAKFIDANSVIVAMYGATAGKVAINKIPLTTNQACCNITLDTEKANYNYIYYLLLSSFTRLDSLTSGAAQQNLNVGLISNLEVLVPKLNEQQAIAEVLSSLDDKIDLLYRQNKTLEELAQTLFRQWFIEEAKDDWKTTTLERITTRITDGSHKSPPTVKVGRSMASVKDMYSLGINTSTCRKISDEDFKELVKADCKPLKNDILIAKDGSYLKHVFLVQDDLELVLLSSIAILRPNNLLHPFLLTEFLKADSTKEEMETIVTGAVIPRIVLKDFRKFEITLPPKDKQDKAVEFLQPIYEKLWNNDKNRKKIEDMRDTLLPKLMSGEVRVKL